MRYLLGFLMVFTLGVLAGWLWRDGQPGSELVPKQRLNQLPSGAPALYQQGDLDGIVKLSGGAPEVVLQLIDSDLSDKALALIERFYESHPASFSLHGEAIRILLSVGQFELALQWIREADLLATTHDDALAVDELLATVTEAFAKHLIVLGRYDAVDQMYEKITFAMPERTDYFLKLGMLRLQMGNYDGAIVSLAQIENAHGSLGARARELIAQIETNDITNKADTVEISLRRAGNQFVTAALLDGEVELQLLIDTGAATTIVDAKVLAAHGYDLRSKPQQLFLTANGVVEAPVLSFNTLSLSTATTSAITVGALPLAMSHGVDGLLGMNFLRHYDFRIDQDRAVLELTRR
jgi:clan AA aspartic protease (TIGR02281 family)